MIIRRLKASFGKLAGDELTFGEGLNIVTAPNEAGKSTWMGFIRAMFYGIDTSDRDKQGHIADKNRYRPWNGMPMEGVMELSAWDRPVRLMRQSLSSNAPMRSFSAIFTDTGDAVQNISGESAGLRLVGVEEPVFERSCFIKQMGIGVNKTPELEKRIQSLISSGEEETSCQEGTQRLRGWKNKIKYNNSGLLPKAESRLKELKGKLERQKELNRESGELRARILRLEEIVGELNNELELHEKFERAQDISRRYNAYQDRNTALERKIQADAAFEEFKKAPMKGNMEQTLDKLKSIEPFTERVQTLQRAEVDAENEVKKAENIKNADEFFGGKTAEEAWNAAEEVKAKADILAIRSRPKYAILIALLAVLSAASVFILMSVSRPIKYIVIAVFLAVLIVLTAVILRKSRQAAASRRELLAKYGEKEPEQILKAASDYREKCVKYDSAVEKLSEARDEYKLEKEKLELLKCEAMSPVLELKEDIEGENQAIELVQKVIGMIEEQTAAGEELRKAEQVCAAVGEYAGEKLVDINLINKPSANKENITSELSEARAQLDSCVRKLAAQEGAVAEIGDVAEITAEAEQLEKRIFLLKKRYDAIEGALEVLVQADSELRSRFSPVLNKRTGEILNQITDGRYATVMMNDKFEAEAVSDDDVVARKAAMLSVGTIDQVYLALRLAVSELILPEGTNPPLILDDVFANFDDKRMGLALNLLFKIAEKRQIILFTCHVRERDYLKGQRGVNFIEI